MRQTSKRVRAKPEARRWTAPGRKKPVPRSLSPYTVHNLDAAIAHLEIAMAVDDTMSIFSRRYWRGRVMEIRSTPGILQVQRLRIEHLLDRFEAVAPRT